MCRSAVVDNRHSLSLVVGSRSVGMDRSTSCQLWHPGTIEPQVTHDQKIAGLGDSTAGPEGNGWVLELWHQPLKRGFRTAATPIYWDGLEDPFSASSLGPSSAVFASQREAITAFEEACARPPRGTTTWGAVTREVARTRRFNAKRTVGWGGAFSAPEPSGD